MAIARARGKLHGKQPKLSVGQQRELCRCMPRASIPSAISPSSSQSQDQPPTAHSTGAISLSVRSCPLPESTRDPAFSFSHSRFLLPGGVGNHDAFSATPPSGAGVSDSASDRCGQSGKKTPPRCLRPAVRRTGCANRNFAVWTPMKSPLRGPRRARPQDLPRRAAWLYLADIVGVSHSPAPRPPPVRRARATSWPSVSSPSAGRPA